MAFLHLKERKGREKQERGSVVVVCYIYFWCWVVVVVVVETTTRGNVRGKEFRCVEEAAKIEYKIMVYKRGDFVC